MARSERILSIGEVSNRTGVAVSALRFYEERGLVTPMRSPSGQRRFRASDIRRISFIMAAQNLGFTLGRITDLLASLPDNRTPTKADWSKISRAFKADLNNRIDHLTKLRDRLDGCIGCGCLSLKACQLYNKDDHVSADGAGPQLI